MTYQLKFHVPCLLCGEGKSYCRKLCLSCYLKTKKRGNLDKYPKLTLEDSFWQRVEKTETCWEWTGTKNGFGYGIALLPGEKRIRAHRYAYEKLVGKIPSGLVLMHSCDNPACVNPEHLKPATRTENNRDAVKKRRHAFGEKNGHAKLTSYQVAAIKSDPRKQRVIAKEYGIHQSHVSTIKSGKRRRLG